MTETWPNTNNDWLLIYYYKGSDTVIKSNQLIYSYVSHSIFSPYYSATFIMKSVHKRFSSKYMLHKYSCILLFLQHQNYLGVRGYCSPHFYKTVNNGKVSRKQKHTFLADVVKHHQEIFAHLLKRANSL